MTNEEWKKIEGRLSYTGSSVKLDCDGYELTIVRVRVTRMRDSLIVYVNGTFKGKWLIEECEERRRFCRRYDSFYYKPKERAEMKKRHAKIPKRLLKEMLEDFPLLMNPDAKLPTYSLFWPSFRALKTHLLKNNEKISIHCEEINRRLNDQAR